jgi:uncharacterized protein (DUF2267 family)
MKEHEIVAALRRMSGADDSEHAEAATRATLAVLGERLGGGEPRDVTAQLPAALAEALPATGQGATFGVEEFYRRVADEEGRGCTPDGAREHARAVVAALRNGAGAGEFDDLVSRLPNDYRDDLLSTAPTGEHH